VRRVRRQTRLLDTAREIAAEVRPDRRRPHRRAIALGALPTEHRARDLGPRQPLREVAEDAVCATAVSAPRLGDVATHEALRERVAIDRAVRLELLDDRERHRGVVGPAPDALPRQGTLIDQRIDGVRMNEEALAEGIPQREPFQREARTFERSHPKMTSGPRFLFPCPQR
jgi:hypothetical protein